MSPGIISNQKLRPWNSSVAESATGRGKPMLFSETTEAVSKITTR
jgi:hypothetical protein